LQSGWWVCKSQKISVLRKRGEFSFVPQVLLSTRGGANGQFQIQAPSVLSMAVLTNLAAPQHNTQRTRKNMLRQRRLQNE
jgi:hypothetical protein